jgi:hypothetical protein
MIARTILDARIAEVREALRRARLLRHLAVVFLIGILVRGTFLLATLNGFALPKRSDRWSMLGLIALCTRRLAERTPEHLERPRHRPRHRAKASLARLAAAHGHRA